MLEWWETHNRIVVQPPEMALHESGAAADYIDDGAGPHLHGMMGYQGIRSTDIMPHIPLTSFKSYV